MYTRELFEVCDDNHVMLICENDNERIDAAAHFINEGLKSHQLCIYATVYAFDIESVLSVTSLSRKITDCESHVKNDNLQFIDFKPFYDAAVASNLSPFQLLKQKLESTLRDRIANGKGDKIMIYADAACCLTEHKEFHESIELETWWQHAHDEWVKNDNKITVICPHPAQVLREELELKWHIADRHDILVFLKSHLVEGFRDDVINNNNLRILIAESEPDIMTLYSDYLSALGHDVSVVTSGNKCISLFKKRNFDLVILDTHLADYLTVSDIAREIIRIEPHQRILVTSTNPSSRVSNVLGNVGLQKPQILQKPFQLSKLVDVIKQTTKSN